MTDKSSTFIKPADRISAIQPYFFAGLSKKIDELRKKNVDVIRLDMGSPDLPPASFIVDKLVKSAYRPDIHGYSAIGGTAN